ncbi:MAG: energy transducer TonB [Sphingobacteriaceae bacterium]|nr:energy transducer TonB [Sphingobacteriaceae bacterium]
MKYILLLLCLFFSSTFFSQELITPPEYEAKLIGGKIAHEQIVETQLTLSKSILNYKDPIDVVVFFDLDSIGRAVNPKFQKNVNNLVRLEVARLFKYFSFYRTQSAAASPWSYWYAVKILPDRYSKYFKQASKLKLKNLPADSSFVIYSKADRSPEYFKNGEDGISEFILSQIEYPKLAVEKSIEGTVVIEFVVETNGYVTGINIKQGVNGGCSEEAVRLIQKTKWIPAQLNGKYVRYKTTYPITFSLRNVNKDGTSTIGQ